MRLNTILCPIRLTTSAERILRAGAYLAEKYQARLRVLNVVDARAEHIMEAALVLPPQEMEGGALRSVEALFKEAVPASLRRRVDWELQTVSGNIDEELARAAEEPGVDLVLMGYQRGALVGAGHRMEHLLRHTSTPILSLPQDIRGNTTEWDDIVLATDVGPGSKKTHTFGVDLARLSDARLHVIHVINVLPPPIAGPALVSVPSYREFALEEAEKKLVEAFASFDRKPDGLLLKEGDPAEEILKLAGEKKAGLMIAGYHCENWHVFGTLAGRLLAEAARPVLIVPHSPKKAGTKAA